MAKKAGGRVGRGVKVSGGRSGQAKGAARAPAKKTRGKRATGKRSPVSRGPARGREWALGRTLKKDGVAAWIGLAERVAGDVDEAVGGGAFLRGRGSRSIDAKTLACLAAAGHPIRGRLLIKLLEGPGTYRALQRTTKTKAGPLYHHINQLRLAGLIMPKQRDLYELTRGGRNLILVALALKPLVKDRRRRPLAKAGG